MSEKIELKESNRGFTERDMHSKAILNGDKDSLLKYKIQRNKLISNANELQQIKKDFNSLQSELCEIKSLLLKITAGSTWQ